MKAVLEPIGTQIEWFKGAAVTEIANTDSGLRIVLASPLGIDRYVEVHFPYVRAFQVMDQGDMAGYWGPALPGNHVLYKVDSGGWRERVAGHFLRVTSAMDKMTEWLVVSDDLCVTVMSTYEPHVREFG
jgi:hypothetical protein